MSAPTHDQLVILWNTTDHAADFMLGIDTGGTFNTFTCDEAEALADVFRAADRDDVAKFIIEQHGLGDDDPDDDHHNIYIDSRSAP